VLRSPLLVLVLFLPALAPGVAEATPLLSQTVYRCASGCLLPVQNAGTVALGPGAGVSGMVTTANLAAAADALAVGDAPPVFHVLGEDGDLATDGVLVAVVYWEDDLTITVPSLSIGTPLAFAPTMGADGVLEALAGSGAAGSVEWSFALAINTDTFLADGGFCIPGLSPGPVACTSGFGTASSSHFVANGVAFNVQAGLVMRIESVAALTGTADVSVDWLGFELSDLVGELLSDYTVESASGIDWTAVSVAEPSAPLLVAVGGGLALGRRRRRHGSGAR
jgi:hypothetical protein